MPNISNGSVLLCGGTLLLAATSLFGQTPVIETGGVQNAASNIRLTSLTPQMLITIKGQNLAASAQVASGSPLPFYLGGTSVTFNGKHVPVLYVSPTQINVQAPYALSYTTYNIVVDTPYGSSEPYPLPVTGIYDLGIFTQDATGCGQALAYNIHPDGSVSLNTPQDSLDPTKDVGLTLFLTGLGFFADRYDGVPWTYHPSDNSASNYQASFGAPGLTYLRPGFINSWADYSLQYVGPAPETVGIDQANLLAQWSGPPQGCHVPMFLYLANGYGSSQLVDVSIQPGGGSCTDPADGTLGIINWQQNTVSNASGVSTSAAISAQFIQSDGLGFSPLVPITGVPLGGLSWDSAAPNSPLACAASLPTTLDAGELKVAGPGIGSVTLTPSVQDGRITYQATPPGSVIRGGTYQVRGLGGSQVGSFSGTAQIPAPITLTTPLPAGSALTPDANYSYTFTWTGGDENSVVTLQLIVGGNWEVTTSVLASTGRISIYAPLVLCGPGFNPYCQDPTIPTTDTVEVIITQSPPITPWQPFSAPGLGMGGELIWTYVFDFQGLTG